MLHSAKHTLADWLENFLLYVSSLLLAIFLVDFLMTVLPEWYLRDCTVKIPGEQGNCPSPKTYPGYQHTDIFLISCEIPFPYLCLKFPFLKTPMPMCNIFSLKCALMWSRPVTDIKHTVSLLFHRIAFLNLSLSTQLPDRKINS